MCRMVEYFDIGIPHICGYLIFDLRIIGIWRVQAHSAVELEDGALIDITPNEASQLYPSCGIAGRKRSL